MFRKIFMMPKFCSKRNYGIDLQLIGESGQTTKKLFQSACMYSVNISKKLPFSWWITVLVVNHSNVQILKRAVAITTSCLHARYWLEVFVVRFQKIFVVASTLLPSFIPSQHWVHSVLQPVSIINKKELIQVDLLGGCSIHQGTIHSSSIVFTCIYPHLHFHPLTSTKLPTMPFIRIEHDF